MSRKLVLASAVCGVMGLMSVANAATIMDVSTHNGHMLYTNDAYRGVGSDGFTDAGYWDVNNPPPAGRVPTPTDWSFSPGWYGVYMMAILDIQLRPALSGTDVKVWNNTGEFAQPNTVYTVSANLGGLSGSRPTAYVLATEHADGTGNVIELAKVAMNGANLPNNFTMTNLSASGPATTAAVSGYYIQVLLNTEYNLGAPSADQNESSFGYIGHITVTSAEVPEPATLGALSVGGAMMLARRRRI